MELRGSFAISEEGWAGFQVTLCIWRGEPERGRSNSWTSHGGQQIWSSKKVFVRTYAVETLLPVSKFLSKNESLFFQRVFFGIMSGVKFSAWCVEKLRGWGRSVLSVLALDWIKYNRRIEKDRALNRGAKIFFDIFWGLKQIVLCVEKKLLFLIIYKKCTLHCNIKSLNFRGVASIASMRDKDNCKSRDEQEGK